jgi:hypothetical protein
MAEDQNSRTQGKKDHQVGFKVDANLFKRLLLIAKDEEQPPNKMARMLFEWAVEKKQGVLTFRDLKRCRLVPADESGDSRAIEKRSTRALELEAHASAQDRDDTKPTFDSAHQVRLENEILGAHEEVRQSESSTQSHHLKKKKRA